MVQKEVKRRSVIEVITKREEGEGEMKWKRGILTLLSLVDVIVKDF